MSGSSRRKFLRNLGVGLGTAGVAGRASGLINARSLPEIESGRGTDIEKSEAASPAIDFRYSPLSWQTAYCFPDDHYKSLVGEHGELRCGHPGQGSGIAYFPEIVEFSLLGMEANEVREQRLEAPGVPIVHTRIDRPEAYLELTMFATRRPGEGRVDNVILQVRAALRTQRKGSSGGGGQDETGDQAATVGAGSRFCASIARRGRPSSWRIRRFHLTKMAPSSGRICSKR